MCIGFGQQVLIPPTERALAMADYLRACFALLLALTLTEFLGQRFLPGVLDILGVALGYLAIRSSEGYNYQQVLCFLMLESVYGVLSLVDLTMFLAGVTASVEGAIPLTTWSFAFFSAALLAGPIVYAVTVYVVYSIYREMKAVVDEMVGGMSAEGGGGGGALMGNGYDVQAPPDRERAGPAGGGGAPLWRHQESHPAPSAPPPPPAPSSGGGGFTAFSGQGRKLGE